MNLNPYDTISDPSAIMKDRKYAPKDREEITKDREIAEFTRDFLVAYCLCGIEWGDGVALDLIAGKFGMDMGLAGMHRRWNRVLNALGKHPDIFTKYYVLSNTESEHPHRIRYFRLAWLPPLNEPGATTAQQTHVRPRGKPQTDLDIKRHTGKTIAEHARDCMIEHSTHRAAWGDVILDEIANRAGIIHSGGEERWKRVLDGMGKDNKIFIGRTTTTKNRAGDATPKRYYKLRDVPWDGQTK